MNDHNTTLAGKELDAALAEALGGARANPGWYWFRGTGGADGFPDMPNVPGQEPLFSSCPANAFSTSVDALAPVEARLRDERWRLEVLWLGGIRPMWIVTWTPPPDEPAWTMSGTTEPEARSRAALAALKALHKAGGGAASPASTGEQP